MIDSWEFKVNMIWLDKTIYNHSNVMKFNPAVIRYQLDYPIKNLFRKIKNTWFFIGG